MLVEEVDDSEQGSYFPEAQVFPGSGLQPEYKKTAMDWLYDSSYLTLNRNSIRKLQARYDDDANVRTVAHLFHTTLFAGGVTFSRTDAQLMPDAQRWYDSTWSGFGVNILRDKAAVGFVAAVSVPHIEYIGVPRVLELSQLVILYKLDYMGIAHFVFFEQMPNAQPFVSSGGHSTSIRTSGIAMGNGQGMLRYIPNVVVYIEQSPTTFGVIRSRVAVLEADLALDEVLVETTKNAIQARANPPLVLERVNEPHDPNQIISTIQPFSSMLLGDGNGPVTSSSSSISSSSSSSSSSTQHVSRGQEEMMERRRYEYSKALGLYGTSGLDRVESMVRRHSQYVQDGGLNEYALGEGYKYVKNNVPESPGDLLIQFRAARMERVFQMFGVPMGMISQTSALGGKTSMNENAMFVFINTQKQTKEHLLNIFYDMYARIYETHHMLQRLAAAPKGKFEDTLDKVLSKHKSSVGVTILLTGLPLDDVLDKLYMMGCLKYDAYKRFASIKHAIPLEDFETSIKMTLENLNGIAPETETIGKKVTKSK